MRRIAPSHCDCSPPNRRAYHGHTDMRLRSLKLSLVAFSNAPQVDRQDASLKKSRKSRRSFVNWGKMSTSNRQMSFNDYLHEQSLLPLTFHTVPGRDSLHKQKPCSQLELGWL